jgi:anti-sigma factor RsiW
MTAATVPAVESGRSLRAQLERALAANHRLAAQLARVESEREALALRVHAAIADPQLGAVPDEVLAAATALLGRLRGELYEAGIPDTAVTGGALGDLPTAVLRLLAAAQPTGTVVPPMPARRLTAVTAVTG